MPNGGVKLVSQENSGVSAARNNGIKFAEGEYIWYVDADDYINPNVLNELLKLATSKNLDVLVFKYHSVAENSNSHELQEVEWSINDKYVHDRQPLPCSCIIRKQYINNFKIRFEEKMKYAEDTLFMFWLLFFKGKIAYINNSIYNYRQREGSAMNLNNKEHFYRGHIDSMQIMLSTYLNEINKASSRLDTDSIKVLQDRINHCTQNILFDAIFVNESRTILGILKNKRCYPYSIRWNSLTFAHGYKNFLINLICLFFPIRHYYLLIDFLYRTFMARRK